MPATSLRRDSSERRSASAASRCHIASRATRRPSSEPGGHGDRGDDQAHHDGADQLRRVHEPAHAEHPDQRGDERDEHERHHRGGERATRIRSSTRPPTTATGRENSRASGAACSNSAIMP